LPQGNTREKVESSSRSVTIDLKEKEIIGWQRTKIFLDELTRVKLAGKK
jgi:hypothetical protein